jgi:glycerol-3-phosphate dehydrogenase (NAD(P)+)
MSYIAVIGAGSWGTTLANLLAGKGYDVSLWVYEKGLAEEIKQTGINSIYLPEVVLQKELRVSSELGEVINNTRYILNAVPVQYMRPVLKSAVPYLSDKSVIINASKGIENGTYFTVSMIIKELAPLCTPAVLSGPSFAKEVVRKLPTAVTVASEDYELSLLLQEIFTTGYFRVYTHSDVLGVELGGALKNVMAIASGISDGLGLGNNARAALITRGIAEMTRLGVMMGANENTFSGLSGIGDLVLTCTSNLSRNYTVGHRLGRGEKLGAIIDSMKNVAEGVETSRAAHELSGKHHVEMPIVEQVFTVLHEDKEPRQAVEDLMNRTLKAEFHG